MKLCLACLLALFCSSRARGDLVIFELGGSLSGSAVDGMASGQLTVDGLTLSLAANDGVLNATSSSFGINAAGSGDATDQLDAGSGVSEFITLTFDAPVELLQLSLSSFSGSEQASLSVGLNAPLVLAATPVGVDVYDFGSHDFALGNIVPSGQSLVVGYAFGSAADNGFSLAGIRVNTVPEPSMLGLGSILTGLGLALRPRRRPTR